MSQKIEINFDNPGRPAETTGTGTYASWYSVRNALGTFAGLRQGERIGSIIVDADGIRILIKRD